MLFILSTDSKEDYCSICGRNFEGDKVGVREDVSIYCALCKRSFHVVTTQCVSLQDMRSKGFLCKLCTQKQGKYPAVQQSIYNKCKDHPTVYKYHTSNMTNY